MFAMNLLGNLPVIVIGFIISLIYWLWHRLPYYRAFYKLPGPWGWPFVGLGLHIMMEPERFLQFMQKLSKDYKTPFISWLGTKCFLYINDPQSMEVVFNSPHCTDKGDLYEFIADAIGNGLFTAKGTRWLQHRRLLNPLFGRQVVNDLMPIFNEEANRLLYALLECQSQPLDLYDLLKRTVLQTACRTTMGNRLHLHNSTVNEIFTSYNCLIEGFVKRMLSPWLYSDIIYHYSNIYKQQKQHSAVLQIFIENLLKAECHQGDLEKIQDNEQDALEDINNNRTDYKWHNNSKINKQQDKEVHNQPLHSLSFIQHIRQHIELGKFSWQDAIDEVNVILAASFETTSTALYFICLCLAMHSNCQSKLQEELQSIMPTAVTTETKNTQYQQEEKLVLSDITLQQLDSLTYLEAIINETMRLFAPVPMVLRQANKDFVLQNGVKIPEGTQIALDIYNMQRNTQVWGPFAQEFQPEKHFPSQQQGQIRQQHSYAFVPFTKGVRMCIGQRYALLLIKILLVKIFRNFNLNTDSTLQDLQVKGTISLKLHQYPQCTVEQRTN